MVTFVPAFVSNEVAQYEKREADENRRVTMEVADTAEVRRRMEAWTAANPRPQATLAQVADHIEHVRKVAGVDHVGLGSDFDKVAADIAAIEDPAKRTEAAFEAWGKSGVKLLPMVDSLKELRQQARDLGLVPTEEAVSMADAIGDSLDQVKSVFSATLFEIGAAIAPVLDGEGIERAARATFLANAPICVVGAIATSISPGWPMTTAGLVSFAGWNMLLLAMAALTWAALRRSSSERPPR